MALVGDTIRHLRQQRGVPQGDLARTAGLAQQHLSDIEHGRKPKPERATVDAIAKGLGVSSAYLNFLCDRLPVCPTDPWDEATVCAAFDVFYATFGRTT